MADFAFDISHWCDKTDASLTQFVVAYVLAMTARIQLYTPVLTGRLRTSIQPDPPIADWNGKDPIVIGTNVEYARRIEYGFMGVDALGRHYHQIGAGMFTRAASEADEVAEELIRDLH